MNKVISSPDSNRNSLEGIRILHITPDHPNSNGRMRKECTSYQRAGATCSALILGHSRETDSISDVHGMRVIEPRLPPMRALRAKVLLQTRLKSGTFRRAIRAAIESERPDVLHVHDMFMGGSAIPVARHSQDKPLPVIFDLHENYPAAVEVYRSAYRPVKRMIFAAFQGRRRMSRIERQMIASADLVLTVTEEATDRVTRFESATPVVTVPNLDHQPTDLCRRSTSVHSEKGPLRLTYVGSIQVHRGLQTVVRALSLLPPETVSLDIFGAKNDDFTNWLRREVIRRNLSSSITFHGWLTPDEVALRISEADLAIVPHESTEQTNTTLPHKLFEYMSRGRPVLVSSSAPIAKHVKSAESGFIFTAGDPNDCAQTIMQVLERRGELFRIGENGHRYVQQKMNWELVSEHALVQSVIKLLSTDHLGGDDEGRASVRDS